MPHVAPTGTRSTTRSQSREPTTLRQTRQQSRQSSVESESKAPRTTRNDARQKIAAGLSTVLEDFTHGEQPPFMDQQGSQDDNPSDVENRSPTNVAYKPRFSSQSASSNASDGTTYSQQELATLDAEDIILNISNLDTYANSFLQLAAPKNTTLQQRKTMLNDLGSRKGSRLRNALTAFNGVHNFFGTSSFLRPDLILRSLLKLSSHVEQLSASWRPDDLFYKANLVNLAEVGFPQLTSSAPNADLLSSLDLTFPSPFMASLTAPTASSGQIGESVLEESTFQLGLELRTQLAISKLSHRSSNASPDSVLAAVMFNLSEHANVPRIDGVPELDLLRGWELIDAIPRFADKIIDRIHTLRKPFRGRKVNVEAAIRQLRLMYPWEEFQLLLLQWIGQRRDELDISIDERRGPELIIKRLQAEMKRREHSHDARSIISTPARAPFAPLDLSGAMPTLSASGSKTFSAANSSGLNALKARMQMSSGSRKIDPSNPGVRVSAGPAAPNQMASADDWQPQIDAADDESAQSVVQARLQRIRDIPKQKREEQKRRFVDHQPNARRVQFDEDEASQIKSTRQMTATQVEYEVGLLSGSATQRHSPKRARTGGFVQPRTADSPMFVEDSDEEDDFQVDPAAHPQPEREPPVLQAVASSPPARVPAVPVAAHPYIPPRVVQGARPRQNPGQAIERVQLDEDVNGQTQAPTPAQHFEIVSNQAKQHRAISSGQRGTQVRTSWSAAEDDILRDGIAEYGPKWASIKRNDEADQNVMWARDQVALKDRARNMKIIYLGGLCRLPPGFANVAVDKKGFDKLASNGIHYVQGEERATRL